ncbi:MAG TPA: hypothetical protein VKX16_04185 [Chloroflexota bacterium]|nr:hypothetical protein [Chloroflexota bacterium]
MYTLKILGARRSTIAVHRCETYADLRELLAVYHSLGYAPEALVVEEQQASERAA